MILDESKNIILHNDDPNKCYTFIVCIDNNE